MGRRRPCCSKEGLNRGAWIASEDKILTDYIKIHGEGGWRNLPGKAGLKRCGKSCRLRWLNYLKPGIKRGNISHDEEELIIRLHRLLGNRWSLIAGRLPGRTDNEIKNYWNSNLAKKVQGQLTPTKKVQTQLTSTSTRKHLTQFKEKKKPFEERTMLRVKPPQVVRTKALRCTKAFFGPQPHDVEGLDPNIKIGSLTVGDFLSNNGVEATSYDGMTLITPKENPSDFMKDFNMDLSNLLDSNFFQLCQFNSNNNNNNDSLRSCDQAPFLFTEEMLDDWRESDCAQHDISSDLQSLALFLDTEEDWLSLKND